MNSFIPSFNHAGDIFLRLAVPMALQCAVLVAVLVLLDFVLKHRVRAALRYGLWLLLLLKLVLPPTLSSPTSAAYWLPAGRKQPHPAPPVLVTRVEFTDVSNFPFIAAGPASTPAPHAAFRAPAILLLLWVGGVIVLVLWLVRRACVVAGLVRRAPCAPPALQTLLDDCRATLSVRQRIGLRLSADVAGAAVCGLSRPVILLPPSMADGLSAVQLRPVLLHELAHIRRGDLWVNHAQCLLQILYWWHPLVWFGNAAIRRVREQAVDEQVMLALGRDADDYPATLLEIAKAAVPRVSLALGLVGILEQRRALKTRIRRLLELPLPSSATLGPRQMVVILLVALAALPMNAAKESRREPFSMSPGEAGSQVPVSTSLAVEPQDAPPSKPLAKSPRAALLKKLDELRLPDFGAVNEPLSNVIRRLDAAARIADSDRRGVNIILLSYENPAVPEIDPLTGLPRAQPGGESENIGSYIINVQPLRTDITLHQALDAIVLTAQRPLHYSVTDYGVVFSTRLPAPALYTRWYKIDPNTCAHFLTEMLEDKSAGKAGSKADIDSVRGNADPDVLLNLLRRLFQKVGVELNPPKSIAFNERLGMLMVRAALADLDEVERIIQVMNMVPAQIVVEAKFVHVTEGEAASTGLSAILGLDIETKSALSPTTVKPPNVSAKDFMAPTNLPAPAFTGILTSRQYHAILAVLDQKRGTDVLATPRVLTPSGRQAQIKVVEVKTIVTDLDQPDKPGREPLPISEPFELGPSLDVVPYVQADGYAVQLTMIPTLREFVGYDLEASKQFGAAAGITSPIPLPVFRTRQAISSAIVWDGQTVVLGLGAADVESKAGGPKVRKSLLVFITPTIVDPAGNRVHTEEEIAKPKDRVPPQKPR